MADIKTSCVNDIWRYFVIRCDEEDAELMLGYNWTRFIRERLMISGFRRGGTKKKYTIPTTLLRTKYERTGEAISQLVRIHRPKLNQYGVATFRIFDFRKNNLICRQSAFPTVEINFQEYVDRYKKIKGENVPTVKVFQLVLPGITLPPSVGRYPAIRSQVLDTDIGPLHHIKDCFDGKTFPGI